METQSLKLKRIPYGTECQNGIKIMGNEENIKQVKNALMTILPFGDYMPDLFESKEFIQCNIETDKPPKKFMKDICKRFKVSIVDEYIFDEFGGIITYDLFGEKIQDSEYGYMEYFYRTDIFIFWDIIYNEISSTKNKIDFISHITKYYPTISQKDLKRALTVWKEEHPQKSSRD